MVSSWKINNKTVQSLHIGNKEVQSIVRNSDNVVLYEKPGSASVSVDQISLSSTKSILNYSASESATITAIAKDNGTPVPGVTLSYQVKHGSTVLSSGTKTTDSNGQCTLVYTSAGVGDVSVVFSCNYGTSLQEIYELEDFVYYHESAFTTIQSDFNVSLPSDFEISFKVKRTSSSSNAAYMNVGGNSGNTALLGQLGSVGNSALRLYNSEGSSSYTDTSLGNTPLNTETTFTWTKNGSNHTVTMNNTTKTTTNSLTHSKIRRLDIASNYIKELKVKAL